MPVPVDKRLAAVCGLFCPACTIYIGTHEDPERLKAIAGRIGKPIEEMQCRGCRTETRCFYCRSVCTMSKCAAAKGVDFCGQCPEYPCDALRAFQEAMPHRIELWKSHERIREAGYEVWFTEMTGHFSCPSCGTMNSAYDLQCRKCGNDPSCEYVRVHKDEIVRKSRNMR
jgi:predicted RNA-binding Zn-ribbon protein involved in translation (DUF1610 family)